MYMYIVYNIQYNKKKKNIYIFNNNLQYIFIKFTSVDHTSEFQFYYIFLNYCDVEKKKNTCTYIDSLY